MKIVFWGTPEYAILSLDSLVQSDHDVVAVISQPDRRRGRGKHLQPSPIKHRAMELGIPVITPSHIKSQKEIHEEIKRLNADIFIVVAFGQILPKEVLEIPRYGSWNGHASLLPKWRGAAPIQRSLLSGDPNTGVCIMFMEEGLDTGPIFLEKEISINPSHNFQSLGLVLSQITADLILEFLKRLDDITDFNMEKFQSSGLLKEQASIGRKVEYARIVTKEDFKINWDNKPSTIERVVKAMYPNAYTKINNKRLKILKCRELSRQEFQRLSEDMPSQISINDLDLIKPGLIIHLNSNLGILVKTCDSIVLIEEAQLEGKTPVMGKQLQQQVRTQNSSILE